MAQAIVNTIAVLKYPRVYPMAAAIFISPAPMPFVIVAPVKNTPKKNIDDKRWTGKSAGLRIMSDMNARIKKHSVIRFGMSPTRISQYEMIIRYIKQIFLNSILGCYPSTSIIYRQIVYNCQYKICHFYTKFTFFFFF